MTERVLTRRELNRALLARQLLLERTPVGVSKAVERLGGLQAQYSPSPYLSLDARLEGFERAQLTSALEKRQVVKALLQRGTLHIVTPRDFWAFTAARRALAADYWPPAYEKLLPKRRIAEIASATVTELHSGPLTFEEVRALLRPMRPRRISTTFLWRRVQGQAPVVHVPPSGTWGYHGDGVFVAADAVLRGGLPDPEDARTPHPQLPPGVRPCIRQRRRAVGGAPAHGADHRDPRRDEPPDVPGRARQGAVRPPARATS